MSDKIANDSPKVHTLPNLELDKLSRTLDLEIGLSRAMSLLTSAIKTTEWRHCRHNRISRDQSSVYLPDGLKEVTTTLSMDLLSVSERDFLTPEVPEGTPVGVSYVGKILVIKHHTDDKPKVISVTEPWAPFLRVANISCMPDEYDVISFITTYLGLLHGEDYFISKVNLHGSNIVVSVVKDSVEVVVHLFRDAYVESMLYNSHRYSSYCD